ncbi:hypothetical protein BDZ45DRAFT_697861 [Acephala macrosclerotiorum]|nr:hypothetical protein BDZ45DRAFT_697861 [Acephala macrosclerotiorum]
MAETQTRHFHFAHEPFSDTQPPTTASGIKAETPAAADNINVTRDLLDMMSRHKFATQKMNEHLAVMKGTAKQENDIHQAKCAEVDEHKTLTSGNISSAGVRSYIKKLEGDLVHKRDFIKQTTLCFKDYKDRSRVEKQKYKDFAHELTAQLVKRDIVVTKFEELNKVEVLEVEEDAATAAILATKAGPRKPPIRESPLHAQTAQKGS